ncbi:AI-2E family transporter [Veillonellaceae bacterium M2-4]|nr:AI-2E family transporter [Veillonellaceae bacterium M2-4]
MFRDRGVQFWMRIVLGLLAMVFCISIHAVYWPIVISLIFTFILMPIRDLIIRLVRYMTHRTLPSSVGIVISFFVLIVILTCMMNVILRPLLYQLNLLAANFNSIVAQMAVLIAHLENDQTHIYIPEQVKQLINDTLLRIGNYGVDSITDVVRSLVVIAGTLVEFCVVPFITFYFMKDGSNLVTSFISIFPSAYRGRLNMVVSEIHRVLSRYIRGQIILSCIMAGVIFLGMWIMGVPYPLVIGLLAAITEWIPIVGPIVGAVPAILLGATISGSLALKVFVFYVIVQQIDSHVIMPQVMGAVIRLHPVVIIIALLIGGTLMGITGMILTVPITAVLQIIGTHLWFYETCTDREMENYGKR